MVNQRMLNGGQQGSGSGLDADTTDGKQAADLGGISGETGNEQVQYASDVYNSGGNDTQSFDTAFSNAPAVVISGDNSKATWSNPSTTSFTCTTFVVDSNSYTSDYICYMAIGDA